MWSIQEHGRHDWATQSLTPLPSLGEICYWWSLRSRDTQCHKQSIQKPICLKRVSRHSLGSSQTTMQSTKTQRGVIVLRLWPNKGITWPSSSWTLCRPFWEPTRSTSRLAGRGTGIVLELLTMEVHQNSTALTARWNKHRCPPVGNKKNSTRTCYIKMHFASIASKRQHLAVVGVVIHLNAKTAIVERSLTQEHISVKDATKMLNMMQQPARLL